MLDKQVLIIIRNKLPFFSLLFDNSITYENYNRLVPERCRLTYQEYILLIRLKYSRYFYE